MFLKKILKLSSIGRFRSASIRGGEYSSFTLFYAGNGRGKTTLCAALRSFQRNAPAEILDRMTFGSTSSPEAQFLLDSGVASFSKGNWNASSADLHIFDGQFIADNVHDGRAVETEQRRNLYRIAIGDAGVALTAALDAIDTKITQVTAEISIVRKVLQHHTTNGTTLDKLIALPVDGDIEGKLSTARATLRAVSNATAVLTGLTLPAIPIPTIPPGFASVCARTLEDVQADALGRVQDQLSKHHLGDRGEDWIAAGLKGQVGNDCPFCGQDTSASTLLEAYQGYFGEAYAELKADIAELAANCDEALSQANELKVSAAFAQIRERCTFWKDYIDIEPPAEIADFPAVLSKLRTCCQAMLTIKAQAALESIEPSLEWQEAYRACNAVAEALSTINDYISTANARIAAIKLTTKPEGRSAAEHAVARLEAIKVRSRPEIAKLVNELQELENAKKKLQSEKEAAKAKLDAHDATVFAQYEKSINGFLRKFNASFLLKESSKNYVGKVPQSEYGIEFDKHVVRVGGKSQTDGPGFQTALSSGDKNALALAFFLAQLERDPELRKKVVVFDDPFTSLDDFRREVTAKAIVRAGEVAAQVIVLSHDKHFLHAVRTRIHGSSCAVLQISLSASSANIEEWDIDREVKEGYLSDHLTLMEFEMGKGVDAKTAVVMMRPLLEKYIRYRFPNAIPEDHWLGNMLSTIKADPLHPLQSRYTDIDDINEFTAPFHHDPNTPLNEDAVRSHVIRTLEIVGGS